MTLLGRGALGESDVSGEDVFSFGEGTGGSVL